MRLAVAAPAASHSIWLACSSTWALGADEHRCIKEVRLRHRALLCWIAVLPLPACHRPQPSTPKGSLPSGCAISPAQSRIAWQFATGVGGIRGQVLNTAGSPIAGAAVEVNLGGLRTISDSTGRFRIPLRSGSFPIRVRAIGYADVHDTISVPGLDGFDVLIVLAHPNPGLIGCSP